MSQREKRATQPVAGTQTAVAYTSRPCQTARWSQSAQKIYRSKIRHFTSTPRLSVSHRSELWKFTVRWCVLMCVSASSRTELSTRHWAYSVLAVPAGKQLLPRYPSLSYGSRSSGARPTYCVGSSETLVSRFGLAVNPVLYGGGKL